MECFEQWRAGIEDDLVVHIKGFGDLPRVETACAVYDEDRGGPGKVFFGHFGLGVLRGWVKVGGLRGQIRLFPTAADGLTQPTAVKQDALQILREKCMLLVGSSCFGRETRRYAGCQVRKHVEKQRDFLMNYF